MAASIFNDNLQKPNRIKDYNKYEIFRLVMDAKPDLSVTTKDGWTPLHSAVANAYTGWRQNPEHSLKRISDLIDAGIDTGAKDINGKTALHWACRQGYLKYSGVPSVHADVVKLLIDRGTNIDAVDNSEKTPIHYAVEMGYPGITLTMVEAGAKTNAKDKNGNTPLAIAENAQDEVLIYILKNGKMPDKNMVAGDDSQNNSEVAKYGPELLKAAWAGDIQNVKELLKKGADLDYRDTDGFNAIERARDNGHDEIVKLLQQAKSK
jgi:ankyrin repeat protein